MKISKSEEKFIDGKKLKIAIIASRFNRVITDGLIEGTLSVLKSNNVKDENINVYYVPGAYEIPLTMKNICETKQKKKYDGIITLGCVIKGETAHFEYISGSVSNNIQNISLQYNMPVGFGVLTCYNEEQARKRSIGNSPTNDNNKGCESANAVLEMINLLKKI
jgi:6,7-dimethyl-8-ribityllumazine synthase